MMTGEDIKSFEDNLFDALNLFNNQKWYEAHDAFEDIWNTVDGDERQIIQGILRGESATSTDVGTWAWSCSIVLELFEFCYWGMPMWTMAFAGSEG